MKKIKSKTTSIVKSSVSVFSLFNKRIFLVVLGFSVFSLLAAYFLQVQKLITDSYLLGEAQKDIVSTQAQNLDFSGQNMEGGSFAKIEQQISDLGFVKNENIKYISLNQEYLAKADR